MARSRAVSGVMRSYEAPSYLSDREVNDFLESVTEASRPHEFVMGDVVRVTEGVFSELFGIVVESDGDSCVVDLRLFTRRFVERLPVTSLFYVDNVFLHLRFPVTDERRQEMLPAREMHPKALEALIASRHKLRRKRHRKRPEKGR